MDPIATEGEFFSALLAGDGSALAGVLSDDFLLIDVMTGSVIPKSAMIELVGSGALRFSSIEPADQLVRTYGDATVITGRTLMRGSYEGHEWEARSRYTHVFAAVGGSLKMVSAQGTPIAGPQP